MQLSAQLLHLNADVGGRYSEHLSGIFYDL
jgi:hypothetical protein